MGGSGTDQDDRGSTTGSATQEEEPPLFEETTPSDERYSNVADWYQYVLVAFMALWVIAMVAGIVLVPMPLPYKVVSLVVVALGVAGMLAFVVRSINF